MNNIIGKPVQRDSRELNLFVGETVVVSKGKHHPPNLTVVQINKDYRAIQHYANNFPSKPMIMGCGRDTNFIVVDITKEESNIINDSIRAYKNNMTGAVQPYSYILGYCQGQGLNLIEERILEL